MEVPITVSNDKGLTGGVRLKIDDAHLFGKLQIKDLGGLTATGVSGPRRA